MITRVVAGPEATILVWYGHVLINACKSIKALQVRAVWGDAPPEKILKLGALRLLLRLCSGQNDTTIFTSVLPVVAAASGHLKQLKPS